MPRTQESVPILPRWKNPRGLGTLYVRQFPSGEAWLYTSVGSRLESTGIRWPAAKAQQEIARKDGMNILEKRWLAYKYPTRMLKREESTIETVSLLAAIEKFEESRFPSLTKSARTRFGAMQKHMLLPGGDIPVLTYDSLLDRLTTAQASMKIGGGWRQKLYQALNVFCEYLVEREWIHKSPMSALGGVPASPHREDNRIWEQAEVVALIAELINQEQKQCALLLRFLYRTGLRIGESCKLRWEDVTTTHIRIVGKTANYGKEKIRYFPLRAADGKEWIPGLVELLTELRKFEKLNKGYLFPWRAEQVPQRIFKNARKAIDLDDGRSFHNVRKSAIWYWREVLRLDIETISELAGHRIDVNVRHYRRERTPEEMIRAISNGSSGKEATTHKPKVSGLPF